MKFTSITDEDPTEFCIAILNTFIGNQRIWRADINVLLSGKRWEVTLETEAGFNTIIDGKPVCEQLPYPKPGEYSITPKAVEVLKGSK